MHSWATEEHFPNGIRNNLGPLILVETFTVSLVFRDHIGHLLSDTALRYKAHANENNSSSVLIKHLVFLSSSSQPLADIKGPISEEREMPQT